MKKFCTNLKEYITEIIIAEKKEMLPLTRKQKKKYRKQKLYHTGKQVFSDMWRSKKNHTTNRDA